MTSKNDPTEVKSLADVVNRPTVTKKDILNMISVENEVKLRDTVEAHEFALERMAEEVDTLEASLLDILVDAVEKRTPDLSAEEKVLRKLFGWSKSKWPNVFLKLIYFDDDRHFPYNPGGQDVEVLRGRIEYTNAKSLKIGIHCDPIGTRIGKMTTYRIPKKFHNISKKIDKIKRDMESVKQTIWAAQRQLPDLSALERLNRTAQAKFTSVALQSTEEGRKLLEEIRSSQDIEQALVFASEHYKQLK